jgi:hypothetical protein
MDRRTHGATYASGMARADGGILTRMVIADPDETCPGLWVDLGDELGYCELGDECRNPIPEAHARHVDETGGQDEADGDDG